MAGASATRARPKGRGDNRRTELLQVRLTPAEKRQAAHVAAGAGVTLSTYARACLLRPVVPGEGIKNPSPRSARIRARDELVKQLAALGNNLNQLSRIANTTGELRRAEELDRVLAAIMAKIPDIK